MRLKYDKNKKKQGTVLYESSVFYQDMNFYNPPSKPARKSKGKVLDDLHKRVKEKILGLDREEWEIFRSDEDIVSEYPREYAQNELYDLNKTDARRILKMLTPTKNYNNIKMYNKKTFPYTEKQVRDIANKIAKALTQVEGVKASPHDFDFGDGSGATFNMSLDGIKFDGGTYDVFSNGDVVNVAIGSKGVKAVYAKMGDSVAQIVRKIKKYDKMNDSAKSVIPPENPTQGGVFASISSNYSKMCRDNGICSSLA